MDSIDGLRFRRKPPALRYFYIQKTISDIKRHDLQIISGNSQAEAIAAAIIDTNFIGRRRIEYRGDPDRKQQLHLLLFI
jgi:hypothetical protein